MIIAKIDRPTASYVLVSNCALGKKLLPVPSGPLDGTMSERASMLTRRKASSISNLEARKNYS
jgi:hypothetical protein